MGSDSSHLSLAPPAGFKAKRLGIQQWAAAVQPGDGHEHVLSVKVLKGMQAAWFLEAALERGLYIEAVGVEQGRIELWVLAISGYL